MAITDGRRVYYDHERAYQQIAAKGGHGWDDLHGNPDNDSYKALETFLASTFAPPRGTRALELGCGGGQATLLLARAGYRATGVDYAETAIELARRNAHEAGLDAEFLVDDCLSLATQRDGSYGLVIDNHVLHCVIGTPDRMAFLAAAIRVLEPGGVFFCETMTCEGAFDPADMRADPETRIALNHTRYWVGAAELDAELDAAGFLVRHRAFTSPDPPAAGDSHARYAVRR